MTLIRNKALILALSSMIGVMSGTLYTLPYFLISQYHQSYRVSRPNLELPIYIACKGIPTYCGLRMFRSLHMNSVSTYFREYLISLAIQRHGVGKRDRS